MLDFLDFHPAFQFIATARLDGAIRFKITTSLSEGDHNQAERLITALKISGRWMKYYWPTEKDMRAYYRDWKQLGEHARFVRAAEWMLSNYARAHCAENLNVKRSKIGVDVTFGGVFPEGPEFESIDRVFDRYPKPVPPGRKNQQKLYKSMETAVGENEIAVNVVPHAPIEKIDVDLSVAPGEQPIGVVLPEKWYEKKTPPTPPGE